MFTNKTEGINKDAQNNIKQGIEKKEANEPKIDYRNKINLIYSVKYEGNYKLLDNQFMTKNKDNIELILNGEKIKPKIELKEGDYTLTIIIKNKLEDLSYMFYSCRALKDINELQYLDVSEVKIFNYMFKNCESLSDISPLEKWNVSNSISFHGMLQGCESLSDIRPL